jgi:hypothetical protein
VTAADQAHLYEKAAAAADDLATALATPPLPQGEDDFTPTSPRWREQSLSKGAAGVAVLHGLRAQHGLGGTEPVHAWLARATRDDLTAGPGAGLWFGAPAVAFALSIAAPGRYPTAMTALDSAVADLTRARLHTAHARIDAGLRPSLYEFDLTRGLAGLGAYWLHRNLGSDLARDVLAYLVRLTEPVDAHDPAGAKAPGWWTSDQPFGRHDPAFTTGHANLGMAHGIAGPLAHLATAMRHGITVDGQHQAIHTILRRLDAWKQNGPAGPWWPERITLATLEDGRPPQDGPARPSWCYGTPGLARAQQLAALALGDTARQLAAEDALARCLDDPAQMNRLTDPALCHGVAGVLATTWHTARDAATPALAECVPELLRTLLDHIADAAPDALPGLIEGSAGIALALHTLTTGDAFGAWPACLLLA